MEEWKKRFLETKQPPQKLRIALEHYDKEEGEWKERLGSYLRHRVRPAADLRITENAVDKFRSLLSSEWITETIIDEMIVKAGKAHRTEITAMLLAQKRSSSADENSRRSQEGEVSHMTEEEHAERRICEKIWNLTVLSLCEKYPFFRSYLCELEFTEYRITGKKDHTVYYHPGFVIDEFCISTARTEHLLLHMMMHDLFLHTVMDSMPDHRLWNLSCDLAVERLLREVENKKPESHKIRQAGSTEPESHKILETGSTQKESHLIRKLDNICSENRKEIQPEYIYRELIESSLSEESLGELEKQFHVDDHRFWNLSEKKKIPRCVEQYWSRISKTEGAGFGGGFRGIGGKSGRDFENLRIRERGKADFRRYLRQFAETGEEMQMDTESLDYIPYLYGIEHYGNMPLVEHLEYSEVRKLQELVIAIDTSGSCKTDTVRRFMEEVYRIFSDSENFFRRMNVYILQCDFMVQDAAHITSEREWKEYLEHLVIHGRSDTDFQPVFRYVEDLRKDKKLKNLRGLLYFTDGDGIYPREETDYQTAFVFYHKKNGYQKAPAWARKFDLEDL